MTVLELDPAGLARTGAALRAGDPVIIPMASPLPYAMTALDAAVVNTAKGRPPDQPCGLLIRRFDDIAPHLDLDPTTMELADKIAVTERANLFVPLVSNAPGWLADRSSDGFVGITVAWLAALRPLADEFRALPISSANRTSEPVGDRAADVDRDFGGSRLVLDGDRLRKPGTPHGSASIIRVQRDGVLTVARAGIQSRPFTDDVAYLDSLRRRFGGRWA